MAATVVHTTAAGGTDSGDGKISKNAWNEGHTITKLPGEELAYVAVTSSVGTAQTAEASAVSLVSSGSISFDGDPVIIEFFCSYVDTQNTANAFTQVWLFQDGTSIGQMGTVRQPTSAEMVCPILVRRRITPSAGSHTYSVRATTSGGTSIYEFGAGGAGAIPPGYIRITRV